MKPTEPVASTTTTVAVPTASSSWMTIIDILKTPKFVKFTAISLLFVSVVFLTTYLSSSSPLSSFSFNYSSLPPQLSPLLSPPPSTPPPSPSPPSPHPPAVRRTGIIDETGAMSDDFFIGESDSNSTSDFTDFSDGNEDVRKDEEEKENNKSDGEVSAIIEKYKVCETSKVDYIPCLDNEDAIKMFNGSEKGEKYERHCPRKDQMLECVVPRPEGYQRSIPWPQSRDEVSFCLKILYHIHLLRSFKKIKLIIISTL